MAVQSRLNPRAAEFFPAKLLVYHVSPSPHHHFNLFFPSPINPGHSSIYYSPVLHYSNIHRSNGFLLQNHDDHIHRRSVNPPPVNEPSPNDSVQTSSSNLMTPTQVLHEPKPEIEVVSRGGNTNPKPLSSNCKRGGARKGGYYGNERAKGYNSNGNSSSRRLHARSSLGFRCRPKSYPVVPIQSDGHCTTVMIKNIPNKYTRVLLMEFLDNHCMLENEKANKLQNNDRILSAFDFLYLPMDFDNKVNKGYAFVNFTEPRAAWKFYLAVNNKHWSLFQSAKICEVTSARLQGIEELVRHFQGSYFECETDDFLPVWFSPPRDGSKALVKQTIIGRRVSGHHHQI